MNTNINWQALAEPFNPSDVSFRLQGNPRDGSEQAVVVAYLDSRAVQQRLDEVCGPDGWSFDWQPVVTNNTAVLAAKGTLTIAGISKSDVGDAGQTEPSKASVSDALKRAAVLWGVGRYLYDLPTMWARVEKRGNSYVLARGEEDALRTKYLKAKPASQQSTPNASTRAPQPRETASTREPAQSSPRNPAPAPTPDDSTALTRASDLDQKRLYGQLAAHQLHGNGGFLRNVTGREVDVEKLREGRSDITVREMAIVQQRLSRLPSPARNGKAVAK